jgi:hypothetical protein
MEERLVNMVHKNKFIRSIVIGGAIAISILTLSHPSSANKKKIAYICATSSNVIIRDFDFKAIGKMSKGQCIKSHINMDEPGVGEPEIIMRRQNREWYHGLQGKNRRHAGYVSTKFSKLTYR